MAKRFLYILLSIVLVGCSSAQIPLKPQVRTADENLNAPQRIQPNVPQGSKAETVYKTPEVARQSVNPYGPEYDGVEIAQAEQREGGIVLPDRTREEDQSHVYSGHLIKKDTTAQQYSQPTKDQNFSFTERLSGFLSKLKRPGSDGGGSRVGILLPLSGPHQAIGQSLLQGAQMATMELADKGFVLKPYDTKGTPQGAYEVANRAVEDGVEMIIGPLFSENAKTIAPLLRSANVNAAALTNDFTLSHRNIYIMGFAPQPQIAHVISYAFKEGIQKYALLLPDTEYGRLTGGLIKAILNYYNLELVTVQYYDPNADLKPAVRQLADYDARKKALEVEKARVDRLLEIIPEDSFEYEIVQKGRDQLDELDTFGDVDYEAVMLVEGGDTLRSIAPLLPFYDIDPETVRLLGTSRWEDIRPWTDSSFYGGWFAAPDPSYRAKFEERYVETFAKTPSRLATLAYDAVALAAVLDKQGGNFSRSAITQSNGFVGLDGIFRFNPNNNTVERGLAVLEVTPSGLKVIEPAPNTFAMPRIN